MITRNKLYEEADKDGYMLGVMTRFARIGLPAIVVIFQLTYWIVGKNIIVVMKRLSFTFQTYETFSFNIKVLLYSNKKNLFHSKII